MVFQKTREDLGCGRGVPNIDGFARYIRYHVGFGNKCFYGFLENPRNFFSQIGENPRNFFSQIGKNP